MIPYGRQEITQADIDAVIAVLQSDFLTQGPTVPQFEQAIADYCGVRHAVAMNSATSALHVACLALGLGAGDVLWTSPISFVASANCALYCGASVDFVDIDPLTYNLSVPALAEKLAQAEKVGRLPKIVVPVHLCGQSCDMAAIHQLAQQYGFKVIEDASHAIGGRYRDLPVGNCAYSDITVFSFHPVKIITTAEGGMAVTNQPALAERMALLRSHGITRDPAWMTHEPDGPWYYQQIALGFNYRMTDVQAALGLSQLSRLDEYVTERQAKAAYYNQALAELPIVLPWQHPDTYSAFHLYVICFHSEEERNKIFSLLKENNVGVNVHYIPIYKQPFFTKNFPDISSSKFFPNAERYYNHVLTIPLYPNIAIEQQKYIVKKLREFLKNES